MPPVHEHDARFTGMFCKHGWLVLVWGIVLLPVGLGIQAIALLKIKSIAHWQSLLFLVGVLLIATTDGVEIANVTASVPLMIAFVPYGTQAIRTELQGVVASGRKGA